MDNNNFDYLVSDISDLLIERFSEILTEHDEFKTGVFDTSPFVYMTLSIFISCLIRLLDKIKKHTTGEISLFEEIDLIRNNIIKAIKDLPGVCVFEFL